MPVVLSWVPPTKVILGVVTIFLTPGFVEVAIGLTEGLVPVALVVEGAVALVAVLVVLLVLSIVGSVDGIGLPNLVCNLRT